MRFTKVITGLLLAVLCACGAAEKEQHQTPQKSVKINLPDELIEAQCGGLETLKNAEVKIIYYFDGNCAFCFGRLRALESMATDELGNVPVINIASTYDYPMFKFNLKSSKVQMCVLVDTVDAFFKLNDDFILNQIGLVNKTGDLIYTGDLLEDESVKAGFKEHLGL